MPPEPKMPSSALLTLDAHEDRLQRLEADSRDAAAQVAQHHANLQNLNELLDVKLENVKKDVGGVADNVESLGCKIDTLSGHLTSVTEQLQANSGRIHKLEDMKKSIDSVRKWILGTVGSLFVGGVGYLVEQVISNALHK